MTTDRNPYTQRQDQLQAAKVHWLDSEWVLNILRSETGEEQHTPADQELLQWHQHLH